jgi:hypothetical protein
MAGRDTGWRLPQRAAWSVRRWSNWHGERAGGLKLLTVNVDESPRLRQSIPTLLLLRDGKVIERQVARRRPDALRTWIERRCLGPAPTALPRRAGRLTAPERW